MELVFFVLAVMGLTAIVVDSTISKKFKDWLGEKVPVWKEKIPDDIRATIPCKFLAWLGHNIAEASNCYQCSGFWVGFALGGFFFPCHLVTLLCCGFAGSCVAVWGTSYLNYLEAQTLINIDDGEHRNS